MLSFLFLFLIHLQVFHYYAPILDLVQLVNLSDLPSFLISSAQFELYPYFKVSVSVCLYECLKIKIEYHNFCFHHLLK